jgi:uncharacterized protein DUF3300
MRTDEGDDLMRLSAWQRRSARVVLVTFTTCMVACGGAPSETPTTTTTAIPTSTTATLPPTTTSPPTTAPPAPPPTLAQPPQQLNKQELRDLVAPVALYPDVVLSSLLPASTNPDQIHDAAQFVGDAAHVDHVPDDRGWDGSVVALVQFPDVLRWLDENPAWTDQMGQAVTYQQGDVLDAIQDYRRLAKDAGNLKSNQYQSVRSDPGQDIRIEPAHPDVVYVPSYDPALATQPQPPPGTPGINPWIVFGGGAVVGALGAWALYSIFDSDHEHVTNNYYYEGGGRRRIHAYDNYYYYGRQRPREVEWTPRSRPHHQPSQGWQQPRRLRQAAATPPAGRAAPLRPPMQRSGGSAPPPGELRREQRQEHREQRQENQAQHQQQRREQRQERQQEHRDQREQRQEQNQQRHEQRQEEKQQQREQRQERRQENRQQHQEQRQERQQEREQRQEQHQEQRQQQREQRQKQRQERREERQQHDQQKPNNKKKKSE